MAAPAVAFAGAWTLPQGTGQWLASLTAATSTNYFDNSGLVSTPRYNKIEAQLLIEYGLTDRLTAIVDPGLQHIDIAAPTDAQRTGLGYTEFGARYGFYTDPKLGAVRPGHGATARHHRYHEPRGHRLYRCRRRFPRVARAQFQAWRHAGFFRSRSGATRSAAADCRASSAPMRRSD